MYLAPDEKERSNRFKPDLDRFINRTADDFQLLGVLPTTDAMRIRGHLADRGVEVELIYNPSTCTGGSCATTSELWAHREDLPQVQAFLLEDRARIFSGLEFDPQVTSQVFDADSTEATCPACATVFPTAHKECPECGLSFAGPVA